jgi:expansin (peptidoglycan-binding protein)
MGGLTNYTPPTALPNCGIPYTVGAPDGLYAAMATADYNNYVSTNNFSGVCGMCAQITGPTGTVRVVHVIDQCPIGSNPLCTVGHIDLSVTAFQQLVPSNFGGMIANSPGVSWKYVACPVTGSITYHFKNGVNQFYAAVQVRNSKYGIASLKYRVAGSGGAFQNAVARTNDLAFFVINQANTLSFDFQVTDANGQVLGDNAISFSVDANTDPTSPGQDKPGHAQFPPCTP